jgi:predicted alpha/beta hydrolase family esterase
MKPSNVLVLPGWQNSGPQHWQSLWEQRHGYQRVEQHDWMRPLRGDWIARLEDVVLSHDDGQWCWWRTAWAASSPAAWAAHSKNTRRVKGALLVAPGDVEREDLRPLLPSWSPIELQALPFGSVLLGSRNDPYCAFERAEGLFAHCWGAQFIDYGAAAISMANPAWAAGPRATCCLQRRTKT